METSDIKPAFTFAAFGTLSQQRELTKAFKGFEAEWESKGYEALSSAEARERLLGHPSYPDEWKIAGPVANVLAAPHFMQFLAFLKEPATTAAIEVMLAGLLHAALIRYGKIFGVRSPSKQPTKSEPAVQLPVLFCPAMWFAREEVLVTIVADITTPADFAIAQVLAPEGFIRAGQWLQSHGVTHPYLRYYIRNGNLDPKPTLSMRPMEELLPKS